MSIVAGLREYLGVRLLDVPRYRSAIRKTSPPNLANASWLSLCNRNEALDVLEDRGVHCQWRWTSDLHAPSVIPKLGVELAQRAFEDWPIRFEDSPPTSEDSPEVTFVIAFSGTERLEQLRWTVRSILGQAGVPLECIIVDQSPQPVADTAIPNVKVVSLPLPDDAVGWNKSWAFNVGATRANGNVLIFHDADIICPMNYAKEVLHRVNENSAASIQRYLFNLAEPETKQLMADGVLPAKLRSERIRQNWEGGTIAIQRDAFFSIGGYDEGFRGWGGEDNEFFDRCSFVGHDRFGYVPFIHLWHPPQSGKDEAANPNVRDVLPQRLAIPVETRIKELNERGFGQASGPVPEVGYGGAGHE